MLHGTTSITLHLLQERRSAALYDGDWPAYWAFDAMIGQVIGATDMYGPQNGGVAAAKANIAKDINEEAKRATEPLAADVGYEDDGMYEERRRHP